MGCPSEVLIGNNLTFSVCTHDPDTGVLTDADAPPDYRVYEDETATPILTGSMAILDNANTTGFYTETIAATSGNGFEHDRTYTIYIEATVDADTGGISYAFKARTTPVDVNVLSISGDTTAADNLELQYDTTGLSGDTFPATQAQLGQITNVGAAVNTPAASYVLTTGTQSSGTYASTAALDGTYHQHTDDAGGLELYYQFDIGGDGVPTSVTVTGRINGNNDDLGGLYAYNWDGTSWDRVGDFDGQASSTDQTRSYDLFTSHVGTGANLGLVRIRFYAAAGLTTATLSVDQIFASYAIVRRSVGYANGAIWVDTNGSNTNTESYVDGTADNPVSTWAAALTISGNLNLTKFVIINGSTITLSGNSDNYTFDGNAWALVLAGQPISGLHVSGAAVTGTGTGATEPEFHDCTLGAVTLPPSTLRDCGIGQNAGQFTAGSDGEYVFVDCFSLVPGSGTPDLVFSGLGSATGINNRGWKGGSNYTLDSDCTLSHEVLVGGGQTITTGGGDVELRGVCRAVTLVLSAAETAQVVAVTGPITLSGTTTATVNLYGVSASLADSTSAATVTDRTVSQGNITGGTYSLDTDANGRVRVVDGTGAGELDTDSGTVLLRAATESQIDAIETDTNELQTDWTDGGRLDLILDARASQTTADAIETDTQDIQSRLPAALVSGRMSSDAVAISGSTAAADSAEANIGNLDAAVSTRSDFDETADPVELLDSGGAAGTSAAELVDDVWDEAKAGHTGGGSFGEEVQTHALSSEVAGLNDLSAAEVNAEVDTALADYDGPTNAEMEARTLVAANYFDPAADTVATVTDVTNQVAADATAISGSTDAADKLEASAETIVIGAAEAGTLSTTQMTSDLTEATNDHYNGRIIIWTSGVLLYQATDITDYSGATGLLTFTAVTEAPSAGDTFVIV